MGQRRRHTDEQTPSKAEAIQVKTAPLKLTSKHTIMTQKEQMV